RVAQRIEDRDARAHERSGFFRRQPVGNRRQRFLRCDHIFGVSAVVVDTRHLAMDAHGKVAASTLLAGEIVTTVPSHPNAITLVPGPDSCPQSIDAAGNLVTRHARVLQTWPDAVLYQHIAVADPARVHFDAHLPRPWFGN